MVTTVSRVLEESCGLGTSLGKPARMTPRRRVKYNIGAYPGGLFHVTAVAPSDVLYSRLGICSSLRCACCTTVFELKFKKIKGYGQVERGSPVPRYPRR